MRQKNAGQARKISEVKRSKIERNEKEGLGKDDKRRTTQESETQKEKNDGKSQRN